MLVQRQILFNEKNMDLLLMSPYVDVYGKGTEQILLYREDTKQRLLLKCENVVAMNRIIECLLNGVDKNKLIQQLCEIGIDQGEKWIEDCARKGVFE